jgi:hypothetical protein
MGLKELLGFPLPPAAVAALPAERGSSGWSGRYFSQYLLPGSTNAAHPGCLQGTFGLTAFDSPPIPSIRKAGWIFHHHGSVIGSFFS